MEVEIVTLSRQGGRNYNEDAHGHWHDERYVACLVADGAGGVLRVGQELDIALSF